MKAIFKNDTSVVVRERWPIRLVHVAAILVVIAACSGFASTLLASDDSIVCIGCGPDCDDDASGQPCPPGPLCSYAPQFVLEEPLLGGLAFMVAIDDAGFDLDTRLPLGTFGDGVFHPPRFAA